MSDTGGLGEEELAPAVKEVAAGHWRKAIPLVTGVLGTALGGPLLGALGAGGVDFLSELLANSADKRMKQEAARLDTEQERAALVTSYLRNSIESLQRSDLLQFRAMLGELDEREREQFVQLNRMLQGLDTKVEALLDRARMPGGLAVGAAGSNAVAPVQETLAKTILQLQPKLQAVGLVVLCLGTIAVGMTPPQYLKSIAFFGSVGVCLLLAGQLGLVAELVPKRHRAAVIIAIAAIIGIVCISLTALAFALLPRSDIGRSEATSARPGRSDVNGERPLDLARKEVAHKVASAAHRTEAEASVADCAARALVLGDFSDGSTGVYKLCAPTQCTYESEAAASSQSMSIKYCLDCNQSEHFPWALCQTQRTFDLSAFGTGEESLRVDYSYRAAGRAEVVVDLWFDSGLGHRKLLPLVRRGDQAGRYTKVLRADEAACGASGLCADIDFSRVRLQIGAEHCVLKSGRHEGTVTLHRVELVPAGCAR